MALKNVFVSLPCFLMTPLFKNGSLILIHMHLQSEGVSPSNNWKLELKTF